MNGRILGVHCGVHPPPLTREIYVQNSNGQKIGFMGGYKWNIQSPIFPPAMMVGLMPAHGQIWYCGSLRTAENHGYGVYVPKSLDTPWRSPAG